MIQYVHSMMDTVYIIPCSKFQITQRWKLENCSFRLSYKPVHDSNWNDRDPVSDYRTGKQTKAERDEERNIYAPSDRVCLLL